MPDKPEMDLGGILLQIDNRTARKYVEGFAVNDSDIKEEYLLWLLLEPNRLPQCVHWQCNRLVN